MFMMISNNQHNNKPYHGPTTSPLNLGCQIECFFLSTGINNWIKPAIFPIASIEK